MCEIADKPWFSVTFRNLMTDILQYVVVRFRIYEPIVPLIKQVLHSTKTNQIIDLCSGGSGPWIKIQEQLGKQQESIFVTLTDKYPNLVAFKKTKERFGDKIQYLPEAVDALSVPVDLKGMRTIFSAFHHFEPDAAKKILQDTVNQRETIGIFEFTERRLDTLIFCFLIPLFVFFGTLFMRPISFKRIFWVNIIALIPWVLAYDAIISCFKTYSPEDLKELIKDINTPGYVWKIGRVASKAGLMRITYLLGFPENPTVLLG